MANTHELWSKLNCPFEILETFSNFVVLVKRKINQETKVNFACMQAFPEGLFLFQVHLLVGQATVQLQLKPINNKLGVNYHDQCRIVI